jgi:hypothetical protein
MPFREEWGEQQEQEEEHNPSSSFLKDYRSWFLRLAQRRGERKKEYGSSAEPKNLRTATMNLNTKTL